MKPIYLASAILGLSLSLLVAPAVMAQTVAEDTDPFQRRFVFHNELTVPIYPVIQAPNDSNCTTVDSGKFPKGSLLRILVNGGQRGAGIPAGGTVTVAIPKTAPCPPKGGFYDAARIFVFLANVEQFEAKLVSGQRTVPIDLGGADLECPGCWAGQAQLDYGHDAPAQLLEYTIISQNPADGAAFPDANNTKGTAFIDFDVSYVDDVYLPVSMALDDGGATQFMGSLLSYADFNARMTQFLADANWSRYGAYSPLNWNSKDKTWMPQPTGPVPNRTVFSDLVPVGRSDKLPSANILVTNVRTGGVSAFYLPTWDGVTERSCKKGGTANQQCVIGTDHLDLDLCCPNDNPDGPVMLGCCDVDKYLIDKTIKNWVSVPGEDPPNNGHKEFTNPTQADIVKRWARWQGSKNNPCVTDPGVVSAAPVVGGDKKRFCDSFNKTVDFVWKQFLAGECASKSEDKRAECVVQKIIGYDVKADKQFDDNCKLCPTVCPPDICFVPIQRNESVQALMRGLPWTPSGDSQTCQACPGTNCPKDCIFREKAAPADARIWHHDKFLHFWAPYTSPYNLNPYARFVHHDTDEEFEKGEKGLAAPGAYSFSIDDFYGNFGGPASTLIIDVGGHSFVPNKEPYDPFKQYRVSWSPGWASATVCGQAVKDAGRVLSVPMSFWKDGAQQPSSSCEITLHDSDGKHVTYKVDEATYCVIDSYTGTQRTVSGLSGVWAQRPGTGPAETNAYCKEHSSPELVTPVTNGCVGNLTAAGGDVDKPVAESFVSVSDVRCPSDTSTQPCGDPNTFNCGKPLVHLNLPGR